jgi:hypothetical protein
MKIRVDIDVSPEEMRRLLGLPDMAGIQEEITQAVKDKISQGADVWDTISAMNKQLLPEALHSSSSIQSMLMKGLGSLRGKEGEEEKDSKSAPKASARKTDSKSQSSPPAKKK